MSISLNIPETYLKLALNIDRHAPGYIDSYYGPAEWRAQAEAAPARPLAELRATADELALAIDADTSLEEQRRDYLALEVRAMQARVRLLQGEVLSLSEEARLLYDISPKWADEAQFEAAHQALDQLYPPGVSLHERRKDWRDRNALSLSPESPLVERIVKRLRRRSAQLFGLPEGEVFELQFVTDEPWGAYNWYLGDLRSRIDINLDSPIGVLRLVYLIAHEGYPGHHTELAWKETLLTRGCGWLEHCLSLINSPSCLVAEGIATRAMDMLFSDEELIAWLADELLPLAGQDPNEAQRMVEIANASKPLMQVPNNALYMMIENDASVGEAATYIQRYGLGTAETAGSMAAFLMEMRAYAYTYSDGGKLLDALFRARGEPQYWFKRLLTEPVTPGQIKAWTRGA